MCCCCWTGGCLGISAVWFDLGEGSPLGSLESHAVTLTNRGGTCFSPLHFPNQGAGPLRGTCRGAFRPHGSALTQCPRVWCGERPSSLALSILPSSSMTFSSLLFWRVCEFLFNFLLLAESALPWRATSVSCSSPRAVFQIP